MNLKESITKYWLLFFFIILFALMALFKVSFREIWKTLSVLKLWQLLVIILLYILVSASLIASRKYLLHVLSTPARTRNLIYIHFSTIAAHYSTPAKIGFPLAVYLLAKFEGVPYGTGAAIILIELVVSMVLCGLIGAVGSFFYLGLNTPLLLLSLLGVFFLLAIFLYMSKLVVKKAGAHSKFYLFVKNVLDAFSHITPLKTVLYCVMVVISQMLGSLNLVALSWFFSSELSILQALVASSTAFFLGAISMVPMGLGIREASMLFYLHRMGITQETGLAMVAIQRLFSTGLSFVLGGIFSTALGLKKATENTAKKRQK